ncbi:MAG: sigma-54 dependent transcriptional regulator [Calditrichia bacterium]
MGILIVDNEEKFCRVVQSALELEGLDAAYVTSGEKALNWLSNNEADVVVTDLKMEGMTGLDLLKAIKNSFPDTEVILMTAFATQKNAVEAMKEGALDYLIKPFEMDELVLRIQRVLRQRALLRQSRRRPEYEEPAVSFEEIVGRSAKMRQVYQLVKKGAATDATILIRGESGTGKELIASALHKSSSRKEQPFVTINCAALPENLLESELFGYEKGAFTGATARKIGKFELAAGGTIFLDEIGDMSLATQAKLLRVLQNREFYRLGGNEKIVNRARVIAATNRDLEYLIEKGEFREDLYYRLNVFPIQLPPLRERKEDIPALVNHFIEQYNVIGIEKEALRQLIEYDWPGNIRELQNVIERAAILADGVITLRDLPPLRKESGIKAYDFEIPEDHFQLDEFEKFLIQQALEKSGGNKTRAAELLGITRRRLYSMMERFNLS